MLHPVTSFLTDRVEVSTVKEQLKFIKSELARTEETHACAGRYAGTPG